MLQIKNPGSVIVLTREQADKFGITKEYQQRLDIQTKGPWNIPVSCKGLCITNEYAKNEFGNHKIINTTIYGKRTMVEIKQSGYKLEGRVSIKAKKYSVFTSSILVQVDDELMDIGVICARVYPFPK